MPTEIERKFLVIEDSWRERAVGVPIRQGYLTESAGVVVRVRVQGSSATLAIKGPTKGITRDEFEYPIPVEDAWELLEHHCGERIVRKTRYRVLVDGHLWEVDEFHGSNQGLVVAEVELRDADEPVEPPTWAGAEVSDDRRYSNAALAKVPWSSWPAQATTDS